MQAVILVGGTGSRLGDAVATTPKPLLEVCGRPFVEHVMLNLRRFGFQKTPTAPVFIQNDRYLKKTLRIKKLEWLRLQF